MYLCHVAPPPSMSKGIRLIRVERNLDAGEYGLTRVELLVNSSADGHSGPAVWAPLCARAAGVAIFNNSKAQVLANTACNQVGIERQEGLDMRVWRKASDDRGESEEIEEST